MAHQLYRILRLLDQRRLFFRLDRHREGTVMITVTMVGERVEIEVFEDEHVEYSRFKGDEGVDSNLDELMRLLTDEEL